jgi:peptide/nickel transport system ATP-binding protein
VSGTDGRVEGTAPAAVAGTENPLLSVHDLRTTFYTDQETVRAVDGITFGVAPRETLGVVGESGSGKSVTARSVLGLVDDPGRVHPDSEIRYHDPAFVQRVARDHPDAVRWLEEGNGGEDGAEEAADAAAGTGAREDRFVTVSDGTGEGGTADVDSGWVDLVAAPDAVAESVRGGEIAMVFQDAQSGLNPVYTVGNQIEELLKVHRGLRGQAATETAADLLEQVGIPDPRRRLEEYPHQFSGGMRQRAVIALALACDPSVLLCDEPTTALDVTIQAQILDLLAELQRERDLSIVFITHDMGVIAQVADRVAVMYAGELVERAPAGRLFDDPRHPYTRGLLESIPGLATHGERLPTIEGSVPTPSAAATDCRFAPRCPKAFEDCEQVHPELVAVEDADAAGEDPDHTAACLLYPEDEPLTGRLRRHHERGEGDG